REPVIEERQIVIHTAASRQSRTPLKRIEVGAVMRIRTIHASCTGKAMRKQGEVLHRSAEDRAGRRSVDIVVLAIRMRREDHLRTNIFVEVVRTTTDRTVI